MEFRGRDGVRLAYQEIGDGRPLILIHGYMGRSTVWVETGIAGRLADRGHRVIMPDMRGHGDSARPHDAAAYPPDVLADDGLALVEHLGLTDYDLGGYSLGGQFRKVLNGFGTHQPGSPEQQMEDWVRTSGNDPAALLRILDTFVNTTDEELAVVKVPVLVLAGAEDGHNTTARALGEALPNGRYTELPGDHVTAMTSPEFEKALTGFLATA